MAKTTYSASYAGKIKDAYSGKVPLIIEQTCRWFPGGSPANQEDFFAWYVPDFVPDMLTIAVWHVKWKKSCEIVVQLIRVSYPAAGPACEHVCAGLFLKTLNFTE